MPVEFPRGRLYVGYSAMNFTKVYYDPRENAINDDKGPDIYVYETPTAKEGFKNPIAAEVCWLPHFDPSTFEAKGNPGKSHMQRWFIYRCWEFLSAKDHIEAQQCLDENQFAGIAYRRWDTWVLDAVRWRNKKYAGDVSDDDGYESGAEPPPPNPRPNRPSGPNGSNSSSRRPPHSNRKRKTTENEPIEKRPLQKKPQEGAQNGTASLRHGSNSQSALMSGGIVDDNANGDDSDEDNNMDTRDPNDRSPPPTGIRRPWSFNALLTPATGQRTRGKSIGTSSLNSTPVRNSTERHSQHGFREARNRSPGSQQHAGLDEEVDGEEQARRRALEYNGGEIDEEAVVDELKRLSQAPTDHGHNDDEGNGTKNESDG